MNTRSFGKPSLWLSAITMAVLAVTLLAFSSNADAAPRSITGGFLNWGVKESFRNYVEGPIANGAITVSGGATRNPDGTFRFPANATGNHDAGTEVTNASFQGTVRFVGHAGALDMTITDVRTELNSNNGILRADVTSKDLQTGQMTAYPDVAFADLDLLAITPTTSGDTTVSWSNVPAVLTNDGEPAFAGFYAAGTQLDPVFMTLILVDNCPTKTNPTQADWNNNNIGDACEDFDIDGWFDEAEIYVGTKADQKCPTNTVRNDENPDAWPPDNDDNRLVNLSDVLAYSPAFGSTGPNPPYVKRLDLNMDNRITLSDVLKLSPVFGTSCTP